MAKKATASAPAKAAPKSTLEIIDVEQGSPEWYAARAGLPTGSEFHTVMASGRDGDASVTRTKLMYRLAGEIITGQPAENGFSNAAMERGKALEDEARESYCRRKKVEVRRVGFGRNFSGLKVCGASPDGLIGFNSGLEIKTARADVLIPLLHKPASMPPQHRCQVQGNMMVFEREQWEMTIYCHRAMPAMDVTIYRDDRFIAELMNEIERFNFELHGLVERLRRMGEAG
jgi:hypothetical protein